MDRLEKGVIRNIFSFLSVSNFPKLFVINRWWNETLDCLDVWNRIENDVGLYSEEENLSSSSTENDLSREDDYENFLKDLQEEEGEEEDVLDDGDEEKPRTEIIMDCIIEVMKHLSTPRQFFHILYSVPGLYDLIKHYGCSFPNIPFKIRDGIQEISRKSIPNNITFVSTISCEGYKGTSFLERNYKARFPKLRSVEFSSKIKYIPTWKLRNTTKPSLIRKIDLRLDESMSISKKLTLEYLRSRKRRVIIFEIHNMKNLETCTLSDSRGKVQCWISFKNLPSLRKLFLRVPFFTVFPNDELFKTLKIIDHSDSMYPRVFVEDKSLEEYDIMQLRTGEREMLKNNRTCFNNYVLRTCEDAEVIALSSSFKLNPKVKFVRRFFPKLRKVRKMMISDSSFHLTHNQVFSHPFLQHLIIYREFQNGGLGDRSGNAKDTPGSYIPFGSFPELRKLEILSNMRDAIFKEELPKLRFLKIVDISIIRIPNCTSLSRFFHRLEYLDLSKVVNFSRTTRTSDNQSVIVAFETWLELVHLKLPRSFSEFVTVDGARLEQLEMFGEGNFNLGKLNSIREIRCTVVAPESGESDWFEFIRRFENLRTLERLTFFVECNDFSFEMEKGLENLKNLQFICPSTSNCKIIKIGVRGLKNLSSVKIDGCVRSLELEGTPSIDNFEFLGTEFPGKCSLFGDLRSGCMIMKSSFHFFTRFSSSISPHNLKYLDLSLIGDSCLSFIEEERNAIGSFKSTLAVDGVCFSCLEGLRISMPVVRRFVLNLFPRLEDITILMRSRKGMEEFSKMTSKIMISNCPNVVSIQIYEFFNLDCEISVRNLPRIRSIKKGLKDVTDEAKIGVKDVGYL